MSDSKDPADISDAESTDPAASLTEAAVEDAIAQGDESLENTEDVSAQSDDGQSDAPEHAEAEAPSAPPPPPAKVDHKPAVETDDVEAPMEWYILKVAFNREDGIADSLRKRVKMEGMEEHFLDIVVPTEDVKNFTRDGKPRITKQKLYPGYIMVHMRINDDTWFLVRETAGISDFTGAAGKPMPMDPEDVERILTKPEVEEDEEDAPMKIGIPFRVGDRVRVKEGNFENQEGDVDSVDETNGNITVIINIFGRSVPMELKHFQVEPL